MVRPHLLRPFPVNGRDRLQGYDVFSLLQY